MVTGSESVKRYYYAHRLADVFGGEVVLDGPMPRNNFRFRHLFKFAYCQQISSQSKGGAWCITDFQMV